MSVIRKGIEGFLIKSLPEDSGLNFNLENPTEFEDQILRHSPGGWSIDRKVTEAIIGFSKQPQIATIVEVGAGYSTLVFYLTLLNSKSDFDLKSIEENVDWFKIPEDLRSEISKEKLNFEVGEIKFTLSFFGIHAQYKLKNELSFKKKIDLVFIDGPQYYFGREGGLDYIYDKLAIGCLILMDDAERYTEKCVIYKWILVYKGLELIYLNDHFGYKGLAVLRVNRPLKKVFSVKAFGLGLMQGVKRLYNMKNIARNQNELKSSI